MESGNTPTTDILALLARERSGFLAAVARVSAGPHSAGATPGRWSLAEIVEHVARVDRGIARLLVLRAAQPQPADAAEIADARMTPRKVALLRDRAERMEAPDRVRPKGVSLDEALALLGTAREELLAAYREADPATLDGQLFPHLLLGPLTLRGWVELAAHHDARHAQQVAELAG